MLEPIVNFFDKLIENFTWRRLSFLVFVLIFAVLALWIYESYTSAFRLARIEKQVALLEKLSVLHALPSIRTEAALKQVSTILQKELIATTSTANAEYELLPWGKKVLATAAAWLVFALFILLIPSSYSSTNAGPGTIFITMVVMASPFIVLAAMIPTFEASWINYLAYPIGHILLLAVLLLSLQKRNTTRN